MQKQFLHFLFAKLSYAIFDKFAENSWLRYLAKMLKNKKFKNLFLIF